MRAVDPVDRLTGMDRHLTRPINAGGAVFILAGELTAVHDDEYRRLVRVPASDGSFLERHDVDFDLRGIGGTSKVWSAVRSTSSVGSTKAPLGAGGASCCARTVTLPITSSMAIAASTNILLNTLLPLYHPEP
jgi:hypothetical protein